MKMILLVFLSLCGLSCSSTPQQDDLSQQADEVVVYKRERKMQLVKAGVVLKTYRISLGGNPVGHKQQEGDQRTPEGKYVLDWRNSKSAWYKSIHISYPNEQDKASARKRGVSPGGDIMIHGMLPETSWAASLHTVTDWTRGCIAVTNAEMDEIWALVKNGTPIKILP